MHYIIPITTITSPAQKPCQDHRTPNATATILRPQTARSVWTAARLPPLSHALHHPDHNRHHRPLKSGAKATALQTLPRPPYAFKPRAAFGLRRVHRRFRMHYIIPITIGTIARSKAVLKPPHSKRQRDHHTPPNHAQRLDCGAFTAAFARTTSSRSQSAPSPAQ